MAAVKTVGIFAKPNAPAAIRLVPELLAWLAARGIAVRLDDVAARYAGRRPDLPGRTCPRAAISRSCWAATARCFRPRAPWQAAPFRCWP